MNKTLSRVLFWTLCSGILMALVAILYPQVSTPNANAQSDRNPFTSPTITVTAPANLDLTTVANKQLAYNTQDFPINVTTDNPYGYKLSVSMKDGVPPQLINTNDSLKIIDTLTASSVAASDFANQQINRWGYAINPDLNGNTDYGTYYALPLNGSSKLLRETTQATTGAETTHFRVGAAIDERKPAGLYTNTIVFTAVVKETSTQCNPDATSIDEAICMQDISNPNFDKNSLVAEQQYTLWDSRDFKSYAVSKLKDGVIWMTQNLDLDLSTTKTLTAEDTDLNNDVTSWTPAQSTVSAIGSWKKNTSVVNSLDPGDEYYYTSNSTSNDTKYTSLNACMTTGGHTKEECRHYHTGNIYNYPAAVATNNLVYPGVKQTLPNSICPKGWRLPVTEDGTSVTEFGTMFMKQGITSDVTGTSYASNDAFNKLRSAPTYWVRSGIINAPDSGSPARTDAGIRGDYWSNTTANTNLNYVEYAYFKSDKPHPQARYGTDYGRTIRCIAR